jgi:ketosteroid isomerase-like protein
MDLERERQRLLERDQEWAALAAAGQDVERILSFWTDDARIYPPGMPTVSGKAALRRYVEGALAVPGFHIRLPPRRPSRRMAHSPTCSATMR